MTQEEKTVEDEFFISDESEFSKEQYKIYKSDERETLYDLAEDAYNRIGKGDTALLIAVLNNFSKFELYSSNNLVLITLQNPNSTKLNSYDDWQKADVSVLKGEKAIKILAPVDILKNNVLKQYTNVKYVFDISQTNLKERYILPEFSDKTIRKGIEKFSYVKPIPIKNLEENESYVLSSNLNQVYVNSNLIDNLYNVAAFEAVVKTELIRHKKQFGKEAELILACCNYIFANRYYSATDFAEPFIVYLCVEELELESISVRQILKRVREICKRLFNAVNEVAESEI